MENWKTILLTGIISLITSIVTSRITLAVTRKNEIRKHILEERTEFYLKIFPVIDILINHPEKIYEQSYINNFLEYKAQVKLLASNRTFVAYKNLFDLVIKPYNIYDRYCTDHDPRSDPSLSECKRDPNGKEFEISHIKESDIEVFEFGLEKVKEENLPSRDDIEKCILDLYQEMRTDLGSNIK